MFLPKKYGREEREREWECEREMHWKSDWERGGKDLRYFLLVIDYLHYTNFVLIDINGVLGWTSLLLILIYK